MTQNLLNYQFIENNTQNKGVLVLLHGLFGDLGNLGIIARSFEQDYKILKVDLRNHGKSFHSDNMSYKTMALDILALFKHLNIDKAFVVGHSMGAKVAMQMAHIAPKQIEKLVCIDMSPKRQKLRHNTILDGIIEICRQKPHTRKQALELLTNFTDHDTALFLLKSYLIKEGCFRFNVAALSNNYQQLMDWNDVYFEKETLFIKGGNSDYITEQDTELVLSQFPNAKLFVVKNAGHMVHIEKGETVSRQISRFLEK